MIRVGRCGHAERLSQCRFVADSSRPVNQRILVLLFLAR